MSKITSNPKVDWYFDPAKSWYEEKVLLRSIVLAAGLTEELKWGKPCYILDGGNVVLIHVFKHYAALLFLKGVLLTDPHGILVQQTENVQSARQLRFESVSEIQTQKLVIQKYIQEAIEIEKSSAQVELKTTSEFAMSPEFENKLADNSLLADAFYALTPGRQRGYLLYFSTAKQSKTRIERVEKCIPYILRGKGLLKGSGFED
jgi:uncharacterized protein YdeI (YjbR/CyaY-like superfamily)